MGNKNRLEKLWQIMIATYGNAFISVHGIEPNEIWKLSTEDLGDERMAFAIEKIIKGKSDFLNFPPTAPAFSNFAKGLSGFSQKTISPEMQIEKIENNFCEASPSAEENLARMKEILGPWMKKLRKF